MSVPPPHYFRSFVQLLALLKQTTDKFLDTSPPLFGLIITIASFLM